MKQLFQIGFFFLFIFLIGYTTLHAQTDNMRKQFFREDTARVSDLLRLSRSYRQGFEYGTSAGYYIDSSLLFAQKAFALSSSLGYEKGKGLALLAWGQALAKNESHKASLHYLIQALSALKKTESPHYVGICMEFIAEDYHAMGEFVPAIHYFDTAQQKFLALNDSPRTTYDLMMIGHCYCDLGNYREAFTYGEKGYELSSKINDGDLRLDAGAYLCNLFSEAELPQTTIDYMHRILPDYAKPGKSAMSISAGWILQMSGQAFLKLNRIDSATFIANLVPIDTSNVVDMLFRGELEEARGDYEKALGYFRIGYLFSIRHNHPKAVTYHANAMAGVYLFQNKYPAALRFAIIALTNAEKIHAMKDIAAANSTLSAVFAATGNFKKAFYYGNQFNVLSKTMLPDEFKRVLALKDVQNELSRQTQNVELLGRENQIKEKSLRQERVIRDVSISALFALLAIGALIVLNISLRRKKLLVQRMMDDTRLQLENKKREQKLVELEREKLDLEMQALRAQMNPHFIFNCLSSINRFILKNETEAASDYLTKFSRLIRMVLVNSKNTFIPLEDELEMLRLYLDMERLRFRNAFDYKISQTNSIDLRGLFIPPLLLQPFAENAIWHGLMHKEGAGKLNIELSLKKDILFCVITDNGVGRTESHRMKSGFTEKTKSLGLQITADRLAILNKDMEEPISFEIEDLYDDDTVSTGTRVTIQIHCRDWSVHFTE